MDLYEDKLSAYETKYSDIQKEIDELYEKNTYNENYIKLIEEEMKKAKEEKNESTTSEESGKQADKKESSTYSDDEDYEGFYGRLYIPSAKVDVALYEGTEQSITDRKDSANIFKWKDYSGLEIADHSSQEFSKLFNVKVGAKGYIKLKNGSRVNMQCIDVFNGYNTGKETTDMDGNIVSGKADFLMYTCRDDWHNIRIWLWKII